MSACDDQNTECPLCMEPLEMDDINFFPCTCGYQICRFCWHRIRTDENGLCPACRKQYPEDPADFKPLTQEELQRIKNEKRQKDLQRKQKISENRKHLANVRVVQKNLVFVVGLSQRLADPEVLKRHEYFGKFGKIHKVVINHSTSYAGSQGPSASAYVTYYRVEDALRAIQAVNNIHVEGRTLKASLGTTKYCSHFLKGQQCPKSDCMYLHELGDDAASFTKEEMQQGKHQEYEKKLHEQLFNSLRKQAASPTIRNQTHTSNTSSTNSSNSSGGGRDTWPLLHIGSHNNNNNNNTRCRSKAQNKENGHSIQRNNNNNTNSRNRNVSGEELKRPQENSSCEHTLNPLHRSQHSSQRSTSPSNMAPATINHISSRVRTPSPSQMNSLENSPGISHAPVSPSVPPTSSPPPTRSTPSSVCSVSSVPSGGPPSSQTSSNTGSPAQSLANLETSSSSASSSLSSSSADIISPYFITRNGFPCTTTENSVPQISNISTGDFTDWRSDSPVDTGSLILNDTLPVQSNTDWQAAFGFSSSQSNKDDDLGFDPWDESSKALADLMEKENCEVPSITSSYNHNNMPYSYNHMDHVHPSHTMQTHVGHLRTPLQQPRRLGAPPGFTPNHIAGSYPLNRPISTAHQLQLPVVNGPNHHFRDPYMSSLHKAHHLKDIHGNNSKHQDAYSMREWQENLRALLPNINITFGTPNCTSQSTVQHKGWNATQTSVDIPWVAQDPAVVSAGNVTDGRCDSPPHWMNSLQQLTEIDHPLSYSNHHHPHHPNHHHNHGRLPVVNQFSYRNPQWSTHAQIPPPGFGNNLRSTVKPSEPQKILDNF